MEEGTYEKEYIETHSIGFDWFEYYVSGREDGVPKTPEWAESICGIPAYKIKALARYWAKHNVSIAHCNGGSFIRAAFAHEPARLRSTFLRCRASANQVEFLLNSSSGCSFGMSSCSPLPSSKVIPNTAACYNGPLIGQGGDSFVPKVHVHKALRGRIV